MPQSKVRFLPGLARCEPVVEANTSAAVVGELVFVTVKKLTLVTIGFLATLTFAPVASAAPCDPNYSGACVPIASDVDCAGGSGNGPVYVSGPVTVVGNDIYGLDRDGNGTGCE